MKKIIILYNIIIFFTLSCNNDKNEDYNNHKYVGIKISPPQKNITKKASDLYDVIKYIPLETNDDCIIGNVKKIIVNKNIFYILDPISKAIFCFNESGRFKFKIHSVGRGPEDYKSIDDFSIHDDYIYLLDVSLKKILKYNLNGKLTNIIKHEIYASQMEILPNKKSVFYCDFSANPLTIEKKENFNFLITSFEKNLKITKKLLPFSNNIDTGNLIGKARNIFRHNDTLTIWESFDNKIYHFVNDRFFPAYKLNFTNENEKIAAKILDDVINKNNGGQQTLKQMKELT